MKKKSKEEERIERLDTAKELIISGRPNNFVLSELMIRYSGLSKVVAKSIIKEARTSISQEFIGNRIESLGIELMHAQNIFFEIIKDLKEDSTFIDRFGNEQRKDKSNLYKTALTTISEKVKMHNMIEDLKESKIKNSAGTTVVRYEILAPKSPLMKETMELFDKKTDI